MRLPIASEEADPERTHQEERGPTTARATERGRGFVLAGKYRLEMLLGEGGMACVWSAYHLELELPVAVKLLRAGPKNETLAKRLRLEARAAAHLVHPSIVRVFDVAVADNGDPFMVMELLSGESLAQVLARERLDNVRAVQLLLPIADALAAAHAHGIVHRDLKPGNVFLSKEGPELQPKLLDFGIAKMEYAARIKLTDKGTVLGSPNYMSPEQVRGDDVDFRSDIWSFSVVLYKALTGVLPFKGSKPRAIMHEILHSDPAPLGSVVDDELARLVLAGLAKDPEQRPRCMRDLGAQLAQWLLARGVLHDACGTPLSPKWLARGADASVPYAPVDAREVETAPSTLRSTRSHRRHWALLGALASSLVLGTLAWADSARESGSQAAALPVIAAAPPVLAAAAPLPLESQTEASITVTISVPEQPVAEPNPKPRASAKAPTKSRAARPPQLPF